MPTDRGVAPEQQGQIPEEGSQHGSKQKKKQKSRFYKRFAQQELRGWSPVITADAVVIYFFLVSIVCLALGIPILLASLHVVEYKARYDNTGPMAGLTSQQQQDLLMQQGGNGLTTSVNLTITKTMNPPVRSASFVTLLSALLHAQPGCLAVQLHALHAECVSTGWSGSLP